ncbi:MAG: tetratricopeptide repeat protein [Spirochaetia bacterium]|nr:tetratricopeptide repeat protein [Spirochaetia bacterium]
MNTSLKAFKIKKIFWYSFFVFGLYDGIFSLAMGGTGPSIHLEEASSTSNMALGYAGLSGDLGYIWQNPAGINDYITGRIISLSYQTDPTTFNQNFGFIGLGIPTPIGKFAAGVTFLNNSLLESYDSTGKYVEQYSTSEVLGGIAHTLKITDFFYIAETIKVFYMDYFYLSSMAASLDLAVLFKVNNVFNLPITPYLSISLDNIAALPFYFNKKTEPLPAMIKVAPSLHFFNERLKLYYMMDFYMPIYESYTNIFDHKVGIEFDILQPYLTVRAGYDGTHFSFGLGSSIKAFDISASYVLKDYEQVFGLSLTYALDRFGSKSFKGEDGEQIQDNEMIDFYEGLRKYNAGNYKGAYDDFSKVLKENPEHELAKKYRERSLTHLKATNWLDAEQEKLLAMHKDLARKYEGQKNYGEAIYEWTKVGEINPADDEFRPNLDRIRSMVSANVMLAHNAGLAAYGVNDKIKAIEHFNKALSLDPEYEPSKTMLLKIKKELSDQELAEREKIEKMQKAQEMFARGLTYFSKKSYEEAINAFTEALEFNPDHLDAQKYKKLAEEELERDKLGLRGIEAAEKIYQKGILNVDQEKYSEAIKDFKLALKIHPPFEKAQIALKETEEKLAAIIKPFIIEGTSAYAERHFSTAIENFEKVLAIDAENESAKSFLAKIAKEKEAIIAVHMKEGKSDLADGKETKNIKKFSSAIGHFDEVVKLDEKNAEAKKLLDESRKYVQSEVEKLHNIALEKYKQEKYEESIKDWRNVLNIDPAFTTAAEYIKQAEAKLNTDRYTKMVTEWNQKAQELLDNHQYDRALVYIEKTLGVSPNDVKANELKKVIAGAAQAAKLQEQISALFLEGVYQYKKRNYEDAISKWQQVKKLDPENPLVDKYIPKAEEAQKNRKRIDYVNGMKYYEQGNWLLAQSSFARALREDPKNNDARKMLIESDYRIEEEKMALEKSGDAKLKAGNYSEASVDYSQAVRFKKTPELARKKDNSIKAQNYLENALEYFNSNDKVGLSIELFLKVLEINPYDAKVRQYLEDAKKKGKTLINSWLEDAQNAEKKENYKKANSLYTSIVEVDGTNAEALKGKNRTLEALRRIVNVPYQAGKEAMALKNYIMAIEKFKEVQETMSNYEDTNELLSKAIELREDQKRAVSTNVNQDVSNEASNADLEAINQGIVLYRQGKYAEAIAVWEKVPKSSGAYSKAQKYIARAKLKR